MSRRIQIQCAITEPELLVDVMGELGVHFQDLGSGTYRVRSSAKGYALMYGGLTFQPTTWGTFVATYDEDCAQSLTTVKQINQLYTKKYYIKQAVSQGDVIEKEYISVGDDKDPLIEPGDIVIIATKS